MNSNKINLIKHKKESKDEDIQVKTKSPYLYNRAKLPSLIETKSKFVTTPKRENEVLIKQNDNLMGDMLSKRIIDLEKQISLLKQVNMLNIESK